MRAAADLSPGSWAVRNYGYRCLRRDVGGPIHRPRGNGRRPEGERNGSRSGRPGGNRFRRSLSNEAEPATALAAQGAMASAPATASANRKPKLCPGTKIAGAGAERQPRDREVPGSPSTRLSGRLARVSRGVIAPGLPSRHPRTRRTSGPSAGDGRRVRRAWAPACAGVTPVVRSQLPNHRRPRARAEAVWDLDLINCVANERRRATRQSDIPEVRTEARVSRTSP